ncbi:CAAX amino terminal protease self- immunity [Terricaulis silvestris]|uniref:CAAX amino terminal protease self-immunity n=2 Tax=Terricaulis silvestris TaxID=2686094 RepID=A0A6I6MK94_9CAUL|nr:CAAX amino terminal protease self- immunity [Terricaulis silvestris]
MGVTMRTKQLLIFFALWFVFAVALESAIVAFGFTRFFVTALMWSVGIAAMLTLKLTGQSLTSLGWSWGPARYHWIALLLPLVYAGIAYGGAAAAGLIQFALPTSQAALTEGLGLQSLSPALGFAAAVLIIGTIGMVQSMSTGLGEEIGWRGFLTPRLTAISGFIVATLITGLIWSSWHVPMLVLSDYNGGGDQRFEIASFMIMVIAISGAFAWLRLESGSLWPAATLHASHNLFIQGIFDPLTTRGANEITMVSEFGVVLAAATVVVCVPFWIMGARISRETAAAQSA